VALGQGALATNFSGGGNVAIGFQALSDNFMGGNVAVGT
jgi:hypothetical protein